MLVLSESQARDEARVNLGTGEIVSLVELAEEMPEGFVDLVDKALREARVVETIVVDAEESDEAFDDSDDSYETDLLNALDILQDVRGVMYLVLTKQVLDTMPAVDKLEVIKCENRLKAFLSQWEDK